jgi:hypothetical protein
MARLLTVALFTRGDGLHPSEVSECVKAITLPEANPALIEFQDEDVALDDAFTTQKRECLMNQPASDASVSVILPYRQMVHVTPTTIMAAQYRSDQLLVAFRD